MEFIHLPKIMVFTPYGDRLEPETVQAVLSLEWESDITCVFQYSPQTGQPRKDVLIQYQRGRELFLASDCDALLVIESDIIPPPDTITKLVALDVDLAYGAYVFRNSPVLNVFEKYPTPDARNQGSSLSLIPHRLKRLLKQKTVICTGAGLGVILIQRHVLEAIPFRLEDSAHCDTWFNRDAFHQKYTQWADLTVVCGHKREDGVILWPEYATDEHKSILDGLT